MAITTEFRRGHIYRTYTGYYFIVFYKYYNKNIIAYLKDSDPKNGSYPFEINGKPYWVNFEYIQNRDNESMTKLEPVVVAQISMVDYKYILILMMNMFMGRSRCNIEKFVDTRTKESYGVPLASSSLLQEYNNLDGEINVIDFVNDFFEDDPVRGLWFLKALDYVEEPEIYDPDEDPTNEEPISDSEDQVDKESPTEGDEKTEGDSANNDKVAEENTNIEELPIGIVEDDDRADSDERELPDVYTPKELNTLEEGLYDLLADNLHGNSTIEPTPRRSGKKRSIRRGYTEEEVIRIARMSVKMIASLYKVPHSTACLMQKNALFYLGIIKPTISKHKELAKYFCKGMTDVDFENLSDFVGMKPNIIKQRYEVWLGNRTDTDPEDIRRQWTAPVKMELKELAKIVMGNRLENAKKYDCRYHAWVEICQDLMIEQVSYNPFTILGFSAEEAFNEVYLIDRLRDGFMSDINKFTIKERCDREIVAKVYPVLKIYQRTFTDHHKIYTGDMELPEDIPDGYENIFMLLIRHRFNDKTIITDAIAENNKLLSREEIAARYLYRYNRKELYNGLKKKMERMGS